MSSDNRPQDPFSAQPGEFPSVPDFEEEGFRHSVDLLEGFEEFMDLTPNAPGIKLCVRPCKCSLGSYCDTRHVR